MDPANLVDRELSWLEFNSRVLALAEDNRIPLLERVRFLSIFSSNLDDFFMIRVASIRLKLESGSNSKNSAGHNPLELLHFMMKRVRILVERQSRCWHLLLVPELRKNGIQICKWNELTNDERAELKNAFYEEIFPVLTPLAVDPAHPFPYISGLSISLAVNVKNPRNGEDFFARVKVPDTLPRLIKTSARDVERFVPLEELISAHLTELFPGMNVGDHYTFRLTRNADLALEEDESENLLETIEQELLRRKFGPPVRLEVDSEIEERLLARLIQELEITQQELIRYPGPLDFTGLLSIADIDRPELKFDEFKRQIPEDLRDIEEDDAEDFFKRIRESEILLHHPYQSFTASVVRFLQLAADDQKVLAIKQTLYRTSGDSPIVDALIKAAATGKQVLAVIEIRARFDELANVRWARKLEEAGVHVVYGLLGLKTHAKLSLVIRREDERLVRYCHVGTGNYHPKTARGYEDLGLLSADPVLGDDLTRLFNQLSGFVHETEFSRLLVAPTGLRKGLLARIRRETEIARSGKFSFIRMKLNSLLDEEFIAALYEASQAGVKVELVVRSICALIPGIPGLSDNVKVRSFLGRFLEHSRVFEFQNGDDREIWIGSADLMHRNLDRRIESLVRIESPNHKLKISNLLDLYFSDRFTHWKMTNDGLWIEISKNENGEYLESIHDFLIESSL